MSLSCLVGGWIFFYTRKKQPGSPNQLAHEIGALVRDLLETITPVIRFLIGGDKVKARVAVGMSFEANSSRCSGLVGRAFPTISLP